jgi:hypothetical protein
MAPKSRFDSELIKIHRSAINIRGRLPLAITSAIVILSACSPSPATSTGPSSGATSPEATSAPAATDTGAAAGGGSSSGACANTLYPVVQAATWNYHGSGGSLGEFDYSETITAVNADSFVESASFTDLTQEVNWKCTDVGLELLSPGLGPSGTVGTSNMVAEFTTVDSSGVTLPKHVAAGDEWTQSLKMHGENSIGAETPIPSDATVETSFKAVGEESITVPAGTFLAMRVDVTSVFDITTTVQGMTVPFQFTLRGSVWYAPGVGMVKTTSVIEEVESSVELTSYTIP